MPFHHSPWSSGPTTALGGLNPFRLEWKVILQPLRVVFPLTKRYNLPVLKVLFAITAIY
ncbi:hypothetical protein GXM_08357 [Nostoc sphaeroides CCNUC1]|uniref:Uncharacterized protein n=1 Tax=Nostoc sphaeroides CCNUC1 TaxID=2653204 RepID=A0A5P8WDG6_9NOSO|nr:hypothetical protein GXM_08357 [Nostoc sphaeroides CCNUC1]